MNKILPKAVRVLFALSILFLISGCKQNESVTQAKYKDLDKIAVQGEESVYVKNEHNRKAAKLQDALEKLEEKISSQEEADEISDGTTPNNERKQVKRSISQVKDLLKNTVVNTNTVQRKTTLKEKIKRSKLAFKHLKALNKVKKALKKEEKSGTVSLLLLIILVLLCLILLAFLGIDLIALLVLTLLVLLIYLLLTT